MIQKNIKRLALSCFSSRMGFFSPRNLQTPKALHQIGFTQLFPKPLTQNCWDGYPGLCRRDLWHLPCLHSATCPYPHTPTPNHASSHSELKSSRKPEPLLPVQQLALVLSGSTAPLMGRSQANMYLTGIMKVKNVQVFEKHILPPHQRAHWFVAEVMTKVVLRGWKGDKRSNLFFGAVSSKCLMAHLKLIMRQVLNVNII